MPRIDAQISSELAAIIKTSCKRSLFREKSDAARTAVRAYFGRNSGVAVDAVRALATDDEVEQQLRLGEPVRLTGPPPSEFS